MGCGSRVIAGMLAIVLGGTLVVGSARPVAAQGTTGGKSPGHFELSETVRLDEADSSILKALERVKAHLADKQWDEAIDTLTSVMESSGGKLIGVTRSRFMSVRDYCHLQLGLLPPPARAVYCGRVDAQAKQIYEEGIARRDGRRLTELLDQSFTCSWGDRALAALGEMALESGDTAAARAYWEKILPFRATAGEPVTWLSVPQTKLELASIRARLVLVSILEGSTDRAKEELAALARLHPQARGRLGGVEVNYVQALQTMLTESAQWPAVPISDDWTTFAGSALRNKTAPRPAEVGPTVWREPLPPCPPAGQSLFAGISDERHLVTASSRFRVARIAEDEASPLSNHPLVVGELALVNNQIEIRAQNLRTGKPAWGHSNAVIFRDPFNESVHRHYNPPDCLGTARFTMTVHGRRLLARMGPAATSRPRETTNPAGPSYLVCLDLQAEGRLLWKLPAEEGWAFEGAPVTDGENLYVAMRRSDVQPHLHVACFDVETAQPRWRQFVCAAETPAKGLFCETTHNLLTLHRETLYYNTGAGAIASLSTRDGRLLWVTLYPRVLQGDRLKPEPHTFRDLTPGLFDRGTLLVAPADSRRILALDAATGQVLWQTGPETQDAIHLLGIAGDCLIASGSKLYWIHLKDPLAGRVRQVWPEGPDKLGFGRGVLAGESVWWPTREKILRFDASSGRLHQEIPLASRGLSGGNLVVSGGYILVAGSKEWFALGPRVRAGERGSKGVRKEDKEKGSPGA